MKGLFVTIFGREMLLLYDSFSGIFLVESLI